MLYVGGDAASLSALRRALGDAEIQIVTCSDHGSAVLFLQSQIPYDLLLLDPTRGPKRAGVATLPSDSEKDEGAQTLQLATLVRSLRHRKKMPIVAMAPAGSIRHARSAAEKAGVDEFVKKAEDMTEVAEAVKRLLANPPFGRRKSS